MSNYSHNHFNKDTQNTSWSRAFDFIKEGSQVLDVGCSSGNFGDALIQHKHCVVDGIEPDSEDSSVASKKLRKVFNTSIEGAMQKDLAGKKYDHIVFLDVIEHLLDPQSVLKAIKKFLKPGGTVVFSIPNMAHVSVRLMLLKGDFEYGNTGLLDNTHLHFYTEKEINRIFQGAGYKIQSMNPTLAAYSSDLLDSELKKLGISPSPKIHKVLSDSTANIFQFVGTAEAGTQIQPKRASYSPDPQGTIGGWHEEQLSLKQAQIDALRQQNDELQALLNNKKALANKIPPHKYAYYYSRKKARQVKNKLTN